MPYATTVATLAVDSAKTVRQAAEALISAHLGHFPGPFQVSCQSRSSRKRALAIGLLNQCHGPEVRPFLERLATDETNEKVLQALRAALSTPAPNMIKWRMN